MIDKPDFVEMSGDLPSGWEERTSRSTGQTYFLNQVDNHLHFLAIATLDSYSCSSQNSRHGTGQLSQPQRLQLRCGLISSINHLGLWKVRGSHLLVKHKDSRRPASWRQDPITRTKVVPQHSTLNFSHKRLADEELFNYASNTRILVSVIQTLYPITLSSGIGHAAREA